MVVIMAGLPGTGKSTLARAVLNVLPGIRLDKDELRAALFAPEDIHFTKEQDDLCVDVLLNVAGYLLRQDMHRLVVLDGRTFSRRVDLEHVINWASRQGVGWCLIECVCTEAIARQRLEHCGASHPAANRDFALYAKIKASFEPIERCHLVVNTDQPLEGCVRACVAEIEAAQGIQDHRQQ